MTTRIKLEIAGGILAVVIIAIVFGSWLGAREEAIRAQATTEVQKTIIAAAAGREADRDAALKSSLAALETAKAATQSPTQALSALPRVIPLPQPIYLAAPAPPAQQQPSGAASLPDAPKGKAAAPPADAVIPAADLKPLYDFGVQCQECQKKLTAANADKADDAVKLAAVTKERDTWETAAKGGSKWSRIKRATKWFVIGAAAGAVAGAVAHH